MTSQIARFETERIRMMEALGNITDGGVIETVQHIGSTSVPGLVDSGCVDLGFSAWPFPLDAGSRSELEAMGYKAVDGFDEKMQFFRHESGMFQLFFAEAGTDDWFNLVIVRDFLIHNDNIRDDISAKKSSGDFDKSKLFPQLIQDGHKWWIEHYEFSLLEIVTDELKDAKFQWMVAGGWALDLFLGSTHRVHHDVDIIIERDEQLDMQKYLLERDWKLITPFEKRFEPWPPHMRIELPRHQVHAHRGDDFIDLLLTEMGDVWKYRREPFILRSRDRMSMKTESGIPYLSPELVLLFKSRNTSSKDRSKDQSDFENVLLHLDPERRAWLHWALIATTPEHPWIEQLSGA